MSCSEVAINGRTLLSDDNSYSNSNCDKEKNVVQQVNSDVFLGQWTDLGAVFFLVSYVGERLWWPIHASTKEEERKKRKAKR